MLLIYEGILTPILVFDIQIHHGADPGESVGKDP
jgi:hypothetical protein